MSKLINIQLFTIKNKVFLCYDKCFFTHFLLNQLKTHSKK